MRGGRLVLRGLGVEGLRNGVPPRELNPKIANNKAVELANRVVSEIVFDRYPRIVEKPTTADPFNCWPVERRFANGQRAELVAIGPSK